jgi:hypothetical protein
LLVGLFVKLVLAGLFFAFWVADRRAIWYGWWAGTLLVACGAATAIALLNKKLIAQALFWVTLLAAAGELVWLVGGRGPLAGQGPLAAAVLAGAVVLIWFAGYSRRHGWIS